MTPLDLTTAGIALAETLLRALPPSPEADSPRKQARAALGHLSAIRAHLLADTPADHTSTPPKKPRGATRWPGLCTAARDLGVTYQHLSMVLNGDRPSKSLLIRYRQWVKDNPKIPARLPNP